MSISHPEVAQLTSLLIRFETQPTSASIITLLTSCVRSWNSGRRILENPFPFSLVFVPFENPLFSNPDLRILTNYYHVCVFFSSYRTILFLFFSLSLSFPFQFSHHPPPLLLLLLPALLSAAHLLAPPTLCCGVRRASRSSHMMICLPTATAALLLFVVAAQGQEASAPGGAAPPAAPKDCQSILAANGDQQEALLCQLSESSMLLAQLGALVSEGVERLVQTHGLEETEEADGDMEKRKHEYLRFGKRKHEYLRFGKRKHEYLRFGKRKHEYLRFGRK